MAKSKKYNKRGGFWNEVTQTGTNVINSLEHTADKAGTGIQDFFTQGYNKIFKKNSYPTNFTGGRRKRRGGTAKAFTSLTNIASTAAPVRGMYTARAHNWVGGKTRRRKKRTHRRR
jgi:hypothetical protein